jgi:hypothetical protein
VDAPFLHFPSVTWNSEFIEQRDQVEAEADFTFFCQCLLRLPLVMISYAFKKRSATCGKVFLKQRLARLLRRRPRFAAIFEMC